MEKVNVTRLNGGVTEETIAMWKNKHRRVTEISVIEDGVEYVGYFKRPDMETMSAVNKLSKTDEVKSAMTMFNNCWLGGDSALTQDAVLIMSATARLTDMFSGCVSSLKTCRGTPDKH